MQSNNSKLDGSLPNFAYLPKFALDSLKFLYIDLLVVLIF